MSQADRDNDTRPEKIKLVFLGDPSVGKTSILNRIMNDTFENKSEVETFNQPTVGMDFMIKKIYKGDRSLKIMLWDTAGQEKFKSLIPSYLDDAAIVVVVYDITSRQF